jgi:predicted GNAT family N-acyltransferase
LKAWIKSFKARFGVNAPRMAVRAHMPWYMRWVALGLVGVAVLGASWLTYRFGSEFAGFRKTEIEAEMKRLNALTAKQAAELAELRQKLAASDSQRQIEAVTYGDLAKQVKGLSVENAALKDDLAFFQSLLPAAGRDDSIALGRFTVEPDAVPGEYKYRMLLVQGGQRPGDFVGHVQVVVSAVKGAEKIVVAQPPVADGKLREYQLNFKSFQRVEGAFKIPLDATVKSVQVRVYQNGSSGPKLTKSVSIS